MDVLLLVVLLLLLRLNVEVSEVRVAFEAEKV